VADVVAVEDRSRTTTRPPAGLVRLDPTPSRERNRLASVSLRAVGPVLLLVFWWIGASTGFLVKELSSPSRVVDTFGDLLEHQDLVHQVTTSLTRALIGSAIGATIGLVLGAIAGLWRIGEELLDSALQMLRTIPFLALVPLFIVWLGIGETPKIVLIALATVFPMYLNTYNGVRSVDRKVLEGMRAFGLTGWRLVRDVVFPLALPSILTGLRFALGVSVLALIAAEQINSSAGLGYLMLQAQTYQQADVLVVCIVIYAALGLLADVIVRAIERIAIPWRSSVSSR
jgi:sulfonate transport system permease protein